MIFVFIEDGTLDIVENLKEAQRNYEGVDVASGVYLFYNDNGITLQPDFSLSPNKSGKFLGMFSWCTSGIFELKPYSQVEEDPIWLALYETRSLNPNKYFKSLNEVKAHLKSKGVIVEKPE